MSDKPGLALRRVLVQLGTSVSSEKWALLSEASQEDQ